MIHFKNETPMIHSFGVVPPLSIAEAARLFRFAWKKKIGLGLELDYENGPHVTCVIVLYGDSRLVAEELSRLGREPTTLGKYSATGETI